MSISSQYFIVIVFVLISVCSPTDVSGLSAIQADRPSVPLEKFVRLNTGMKKSEVDKTFGTRGDHQFTYLGEDHHIYVFVSYEVTSGSEFSYPFDLLFRDGELFAVLDVRHEHDYLKSLPKDARLFSPHSFDDDSGIQEFFKIKSLRGQEISKSMPNIRERVVSEERKWKEVQQKSHPNPNRAALDLSASPQQAREYEINAQQAKKFDAEKITIGMTKEEVSQVFGDPRYSEDLNVRFRVGLYGPARPRKVNSDVAASPVMVLFRDGSVIRVLSHRFFEDSWRKKIWPRDEGEGNKH